MSTDAPDVGFGTGTDSGTGTATGTGTDDADRADSPEELDPSGRPCLEQRFSPWLRVRTAVLEDGLLVQVRRPFSERVALVGYERLLLDPAGVRGLVRLRLLACLALLVLGAAASALPVAAWLGPSFGPPAAAWLPPALLVASALLLIETIGAPRRVTMLLDRELALHPVFLRDREDEPRVEAFLELVRRAAIEWRCRTPAGEDDTDEGAPKLGETLDRLVAMRTDGLLDETQLARFRDLAVGR